MRRLENWRSDETSQISEHKNRELKQLTESLLTEEEQIAASYERRRQIVLASSADPTEQQRLLAKLQSQRDVELAFEAERQAENRDRMLQTQETQLELMQAHYDAEQVQLRAALDQKIITQEEYERRKIQRQTLGVQITAAESAFGALADLTEQYGGKQSKAYRAMFAIQKAFAIAKVALDMQQSISDAAAKGWPQNIPLIAQAIAQGAQSTIRSISYHDDGGRIPAGGIGIVGERGAEIVQGPAQVISRRDTARLLNRQESGDGAAAPIVTINVSVDARGNATSTTESSGPGDAETAKKLGALIDERTRAILIRKQRQGGC
jgi:hypothetical protein